MEFDGHAGIAESLGIGEILVSENVELAPLEVVRRWPDLALAVVSSSKTAFSKEAIRPPLTRNSAMSSSLSCSLWCVSTSWSLRRDGLFAHRGDTTRHASPKWKKSSTSQTNVEL
jgi:hypothetical protein